MSEDFKRSVYEWKAHGDWRFADHEAAWKFFFEQGQNAPASQRWQPIQTAPMDGTVIIAKGFYGLGKLRMDASAVRFADGLWWRDNVGYGFTVACCPIGWIPMPEGDAIDFAVPSPKDGKHVQEKLMAIILHKDGAYQLYSTIADGPEFVCALTLDQITQYANSKYGEEGLRRLPHRLARAHAVGCSSHIHESLEDCIKDNRAGPNESNLSYDEFIRMYLTLPSPRTKETIMNKKEKLVKELLVKSGIEVDGIEDPLLPEMVKFVDLLVRECVKVARAAQSNHDDADHAIETHFGLQ